MNKVVKEILSYALIIILVLLFKHYIMSPIRVDGDSMNPTLKNGDIMLLNEIGKKSIDRFDIVVIDTEEDVIVKRVIGLPGETLEYKDGFLYINGKRTHDDFVSLTRDFTLESATGKKKIPSGYYFVMGDNRRNSLDSRDSRVGLVKKSNIIGKPIIRIWPLNKIGAI